MLSYRQRLRGEYVGVPTQDVNIFFIERPSRPKTSLIPHADGTGVGGLYTKDCRLASTRLEAKGLGGSPNWEWPEMGVTGQQGKRVKQARGRTRARELAGGPARTQSRPRAGLAFQPRARPPAGTRKQEHRLN